MKNATTFYLTATNIAHKEERVICSSTDPTLVALDYQGGQDYWYRTGWKDIRLQDNGTGVRVDTVAVTLDELYLECMIEEGTLGVLKSLIDS